MATCKEENPQTRAFLARYDEMIHNIHDPMALADHLYSLKLLPDATYDELVSIATLSQRDKTRKIMRAMQAQLSYNPSVFDRFVEALRSDRSRAYLADNLVGSLTSILQGSATPSLEETRTVVSAGDTEEWESESRRELEREQEGIDSKIACPPVMSPARVPMPLAMRGSGGQGKRLADSLMHTLGKPRDGKIASYTSGK